MALVSASQPTPAKPTSAVQRPAQRTAPAAQQRPTPPSGSGMNGMKQSSQLSEAQSPAAPRPPLQAALPLRDEQRDAPAGASALKPSQHTSGQSAGPRHPSECTKQAQQATTTFRAATRSSRFDTAASPQRMQPAPSKEAQPHMAHPTGKQAASKRASTQPAGVQVVRAPAHPPTKPTTGPAAHRATGHAEHQPSAAPVTPTATSRSEARHVSSSNTAVSATAAAAPIQQANAAPMHSIEDLSGDEAPSPQPPSSRPDSDAVSSGTALPSHVATHSAWQQQRVAGFATEAQLRVLFWLR